VPRTGCQGLKNTADALSDKATALIVDLTDISLSLVSRSFAETNDQRAAAVRPQADCSLARAPHRAAS